MRWLVVWLVLTLAIAAAGNLGLRRVETAQAQACMAAGGDKAECYARVGLGVPE